MLYRCMVSGPEDERKQLLLAKGIIETLLSRMKEFQLNLDNLRKRREINVGTSRALEEAVSSAYLVALNLRTTLSPFWTPGQSSSVPQELGTLVEMGAELATSCSRCGRGVKAEFKLCPYCGYELRPRSCQGCGKEVLAEFKFCPHCGKRSEKAVTSGPTEVHTEVRDLH